MARHGLAWIGALASLSLSLSQSGPKYPTKVLDGTCTLLTNPMPTGMLTPRGAGVGRAVMATPAPPPNVETSIFASMTQSSTYLFGILNSWSQDWTTLDIVTRLMPQPTPGVTVAQTIVHSDIVNRLATTTIFQFDACARTMLASTSGITSLTTYVVYPSAETYLPASATGPDSVPCTAEAVEGVAASEPDEECKALGMDTACIGQCEMIDDGSFRCRKGRQNELKPVNIGRLGRACWLANDTFHQLVKPCLESDRWVGCSPAGQWDERYRPLLWV